MSDLWFPRPAERRPSTVMTAILNPMSYVRARRLAAAGLAAMAVAITGADALALDDPAEPRLQLNEPIGSGPDPGALRPFFEKIGQQRDCNYLTYRLRFGMRGDGADFANPALAATLRSVRFDISDQLPSGLTVIHVQATGDGTNADGAALPAAGIGTTAGPDDTAKLADFRLSAHDLDGSGEVNERYVEIRIVAAIDPLALPVQTVVDNQGWARAQPAGEPAVDIPSHDPAEPDDGSFLTGEKTSTVIDVTGCGPPPPGDREPCFDVVIGKVDCVPGGAFNYHMPVGPELGGKWVQLRTTTPGIAVSPAQQPAPVGGGTLDWTIIGAAPGDVVNIIVTGIEPYAGPKEGVGLCCSQTLDIVIPEDLNCPDEDKEPDIKVIQRAEAPGCTVEGGCDFTVTVMNAGDAPYHGPIVLDDVVLPGNAALLSGPNAPWACAPPTSPMTCAHPATTLDPGASIDLRLGFALGPGAVLSGIRNCAAYNYGDSGKEPFGEQTNDKACATIPVCIPGENRACALPQENNTDISIHKSALGPVCSTQGVCHWRIDLINSGTATIDGPLTVVDEFPAGVPAAADFGPAPPWSCAPDGTGRFRCNHPGIVLVPGATTAIHVRTVGGGAFGRDRIENCAEVLPVAGETELADNRSCETVRIPHRNPGKPVPRITKSCDGAGKAGQIRTREGRCVCPSGTELRGGACRKAKVE